jgi:predicted metalloprotease with PDZ domain
LRRALRIVAFVSAWFALSAAAQATINYEISLANPEQHLFHVTMTIPGVKDEVTVQMAAWNALYQIRDFSSHVQQVQAFTGSEPLPIEKVDKQTWVIRGTGEIVVRYTTYWDEPGPFGTELNAHHAFINPAMVLLYVPSRRKETVSVKISDAMHDWRVATPCTYVMERISLAHAEGITADGYDALADCPVEVGAFSFLALKNSQPPVTVVVDGDHWSQSEVESELSRIVGYELKLMGGAPYPAYTFILHIGKGAENAGGGMEHANGTAINVSSEEQLAGVAAHEFFHLWNVKRIRPASLEPVDYTKEQYTRALWFAEGVTSTYGSYTLLRSGLWSKEQFYADLSDRINELESRPANKWQSAEQSSLDAWLEKYPWYNGPEFSVSYYTKGQILGVLLDILIRDRSNNAKSLDDVMRLMNDEFAKKGKPYRDDADIELSVEKIAGSSFAEFFRKYVAGAEPLPYEDTLRRAGLEFREVSIHRAGTAFKAERGPGAALTVYSVEPQSAAWKAGLRPGDVILSWNGGNPPRFISGWTRRRKPGEMLRLVIVRDGKQSEVAYALGDSPELSRQIVEAGNADEKARRIREGILNGETQSAAAAGLSK